MTRWSSKRAVRHLVCAIGASALMLSFSGLISGCGPEAQTPVQAPTTGAVPGGGSADEYGKKMMEMQKQKNSSGGGAATTK